MKHWFFILFLFAATLISAENLTIIDINHGYVRVNGRKLQKGSSFESTDKISWLDDKQVIKAAGQESHKVIILAAQIFKVGRITTIEDLLFQKQALSSRDGVLMNAQDFALFFNKEIALMHSISVETGYTFDMNHFLFLQYNYKDEIINKKLSCTKHNVILNDSIFTIDGKPFEPTTLKSQLYLYDGTSGQITLLADELVINVSPRDSCKSLIGDNAVFLTKKEMVNFICDYCKIKYPSITFFSTDIESFVDQER